MSRLGSLPGSREKEKPPGASITSHTAIVRNLNEDEPFLDEIKAINSKDELVDLREIKRSS